MPLHAGKAAGAVRALLLCLSLSLLSSCGGGGSSASSSGPGGKPAIPQPDYNGSRDLASLDESSAASSEQLLAVAVNFLQENGGATTENYERKTYNETDNGTTGTVTLTGTVNPDGTGWVQQVFSNYESQDFPGQLETGTWVVETTQSGSVLGVQNLSIKADGQTFLYNGSISAHNLTVTGNLTIEVGNDQTFISNLAVAQNGADIAVSGRVYDSARGYLTVATPIPGNIGTFGGSFIDLFLNNGSGKVTLTGKGGSVLTVEPLGDNFMFLGLDADGDGKIESGARMPLGTGKLDLVQPAGTHVLALAEVPAQTATSDITVDGRYSYTPGGFVNYKWSLLAAPLGSTATVSGDEPTVQFTPDVAGQYLLKLTASAAGGNESSIDVIPVSSVMGKISGTSEKLPGYIYVHAGQSVAIDGRATNFVESPSDTTSGTWTLNAPAGSHARLANTKGEMPSFTPDVAGLYYVTDPEGGTDAADTTVVAVDTPVRFAWPVEIAQSTQSPVIGRFGGSNDSFAFQGSQTTPDTQWWQPATGGLFTEGGSLALNSGETSGLLTTDLNGDGVSDFVTATATTVTGCPLVLRTSSGGGYTSSSAALATPCPLGTDMGPINAGTFGGKPGLVFTATYNTHPSIIALVEDSSGVMQAPVVTSIQGTADLITGIAVQDFTGDGISDLAISLSESVGGSYENMVQIYKGDVTGAFTYLASYNLASSSGSPFFGYMAVGDFKGNGKLDIAVAVNIRQTLYLLYGDGTGAFPTSDTRAISGQPVYLAAADINGDHKADVIAGYTHSSGPTISQKNYDVIGIFFGEATGIGNEEDYPLPNIDAAGANGTMQLVSDDLNGDGLPDLILETLNKNLFYVPTLPAITSATITSVDSAEVRVSSALSKRTAAMAQSPWVEHATPLAHVRLDLGSPPRE